jgi:drug/metabolite transporter (DMT)-like permease
MAMFIFREIPSLYTVVGGIIIIGGIYYYLMTQNTIKDKKNKI